MPWTWDVEVLLELPPDKVAQRLPATLAELDAEGDGTRLRMRVGSLDWTARVLAGLGCSFTIRRPEELRASVRALADRLVVVQHQRWHAVARTHAVPAADAALQELGIPVEGQRGDVPPDRAAVDPEPVRDLAAGDERLCLEQLEELEQAGGGREHRTEVKQR